MSGEDSQLAKKLTGTKRAKRRLSGSKAEKFFTKKVFKFANHGFNDGSFC
jgi:hypothetical protein